MTSAAPEHQPLELTAPQQEASAAPSQSPSLDQSAGQDNSRQDASASERNIADAFNEQTHYVPVRQIVTVFLACSTVDFVALMDQTSLAVALVSISSDLKAGANAPWISSAYFITSTSCQLLYGRLSDILGRKHCLLAGLAIFFLGSLAASLAPNVISLIVFRAICGIGGGGLMSIAQIIVGDVVPLRERGKYQGIVGAAVAIANGTGPLVGGALSSGGPDSWRNIFRLNLPLSFVCALCVIFFMPLRPVQASWRTKLMAVDYFGAVLTLGSTTAIILGLTWAGGDYGWDSAHVLAPLLTGLFLLGFFLLWQWKGARLPLMPLHIFRNRMVCGACVTMFINGWLFLGQTFYIPQFYQLAYGYGNIKAGALLLPLTVAQTIMSTLSGLIVKWTGRYRESILFGWAIWSIGLGLFSTLDEASGVGKQVGFAILTGVGVGFTLQPSLVAIQSAVERKDMAVVTATRNYVRNLGGSVGLALSGTLVLNQLRSSLIGQIEEALLESQLFRSAYRQGFRSVFLVMASLSTAAFVVALLLIPQSSVDRDDDELQKRQALQRIAARHEEKKWNRRAAEEGPDSNGTGEEGK